MNIDYVLRPLLAAAVLLFCKTMLIIIEVSCTFSHADGELTLLDHLVNAYRVVAYNLRKWLKRAYRAIGRVLG